MSARPELVLRAAALVCEFPDGGIAAMARFLDDVDAYEEEAIERAKHALGYALAFRVQCGRCSGRGALRAYGRTCVGVSVRYDERVDPGRESDDPDSCAVRWRLCGFRAARELGYDAQGRAEALYELDESLRRTGAPALLNPPVPEAGSGGRTRRARRGRRLRGELSSARDPRALWRATSGGGLGVRFLGHG